jgi:hypothetical protein
MGETMKKSLIGVILIGLTCCATVHAKSQNVLRPIQQVTVTQVTQTEEERPFYCGGDNPSDAPLRSEVYSYEVAVRSECSTFVSRYQSPYDYFPSAFSTNAQLPARITKHDIYFELPSGREMKMPIVKKRPSSAPGCEVHR